MNEASPTYLGSSTKSVSFRGMGQEKHPKEGSHSFSSHAGLANQETDSDGLCRWRHLTEHNRSEIISPSNIIALAVACHARSPARLRKRHSTKDTQLLLQASHQASQNSKPRAPSGLEAFWPRAFASLLRAFASLLPANQRGQRRDTKRSTGKPETQDKRNAMPPSDDLLDPGLAPVSSAVILLCLCFVTTTCARCQGQGSHNPHEAVARKCLCKSLSLRWLFLWGHGERGRTSRQALPLLLLHLRRTAENHGREASTLEAPRSRYTSWSSTSFGCATWSHSSEETPATASLGRHPRMVHNFYCPFYCPFLKPSLCPLLAKEKAAVRFRLWNVVELRLRLTQLLHQLCLFHAALAS